MGHASSRNAEHFWSDIHGNMQCQVRAWPCTGKTQNDLTGIEVVVLYIWPTALQQNALSMVDPQQLQDCSGWSEFIILPRGRTDEYSDRDR